MRCIFFGTVAFIAFTNLASACGTERWPVKIGIDQDVGKVSTEAKPTTIAELTSLIHPQHPTGRENKRYSPVELTTYEVTGTLTVIKKEADQDYHLVIQDHGLTMIVESPDPQCAQGSRFLPEIKEVRQAIDAKFGPIEQRLTPNIRVTVIGVGFFDLKHDQEGVAQNAIEIHPITEIAFH